MAVASGEAVAGFAIESVARQMKLGFIPLTEERYDLTIWRAAYFEPPMQRLWQFCATDAFNERAIALGGYRMDGFGTCLLYTSPSPRDQRGSRMPSSA